MHVDREEVEKRFTYHAPQQGQPERYAAIRDKAKELALVILDNCPPSREQSSALTRLEEAVFHANAGIARRG